MSTASSFFGGGGGGATIKSIQRGTISIAGGTNSATATITAVNAAKTELRYLGGGGIDSNGFPVFATVVLTNSTTITASRASTNTPGAAMSASWELTEFN